MSARFTIFTKPWQEPDLETLARYIQKLGFDGIELPLRDGYQVEPGNAAKRLPEAISIFADHGLTIDSIASDPSESIIEAVGATETKPIIRMMAKIDDNKSYLEEEERYIRLLESFVPALERTGVRIGLQNHDRNFIANACGLKRVLDHFDPKHITAVWDPGHCAMVGEIPEHAIDILWSHLSIVNLKNPIWRLVTGPEAEEAVWERYWTTARQGLAPWSRIARLLNLRDFSGPVCFHAEYSDEPSLERLALEDLEYARSIFSEG